MQLSKQDLTFCWAKTTKVYFPVKNKVLMVEDQSDACASQRHLYMYRRYAACDPLSLYAYTSASLANEILTYLPFFILTNAIYHKLSSKVDNLLTQSLMPFNNQLRIQSEADLL